MARKRGRDESEVSPTVDASDVKRQRAKALRSGDEELSATDTASSRSSVTFSSGEAVTGEEDGNVSDDETSSSGSSPSSSSAESESADELIEDEDGPHDREDESITYVPGRPRPRIQRIQRLDQSGLMSRLSSFLPQLRAANEGLEREIASGNARDVRMDDVQEEDEQYIEMNLGLGVLKETNGSTGDSESGSCSEDDIDSVPDRTEPSESRNSDVMDRLMGQKTHSKQQRSGIEEVDDS